MVFNFLAALSDPAALLCRQGYVITANHALREMAGVSVGDSMSSYLTQQSFSALIEQGIVSAAAGQVWRHSVDVMTGESKPRSTEISCTRLHLADQPESFVLVFNDQSTRMFQAAARLGDELANHKIRRRERQVPGEIELDRDGRICAVNDVALDLTGCAIDQLIHTRFWSLSCWPDRVDLELNARRCLDVAFRGEPERMPIRLTRPSGRIAWMELSFTPRHHEDGSINRVLVEAVDVTARVVSEISRRQYTERLVNLSRQLLRTQEAERRNLSMELHDDIGQSLTALRLSLHNVRKSVEEETQADRLTHCMSVADQVLNKIRNMSLVLRPPMLDDLGLIAALEWFTVKQAELTGLDIELHTDLDGLRWSSAQEVAVFRIVQEAVSNAMRHSGATSIVIAVTLNSGRLEVRVQDNGKGFCAEMALEQATDGSSLGLLGMQQRAALVNGEIELESNSTTGTCVTLRIPV